MVNLHELTEPIYYGTLKHLQENSQKPLESLQGNILHGHGRDRSVHIFLRFKVGKETDVKRWIKELAEHITSAQRQLDETERYRRDKTPGRLFMNFFLSAKGYEYLYPEQKGKLRFDDEAFLYGMKAAQHRLNDLPKEAWEEGYRHDIHAMVLLADDDESILRGEANKLCGDVQTYAEVCAVEWIQRGDKLTPVEHLSEDVGLSDSYTNGQQPNRIVPPSHLRT